MCAVAVFYWIFQLSEDYVLMMAKACPTSEDFKLW